MNDIVGGLRLCRELRNTNSVDAPAQLVTQSSTPTRYAVNLKRNTFRHIESQRMHQAVMAHVYDRSQSLLH